MPRWNAEDQPEHQITLETVADVIALKERAEAAGFPAQVVMKLPTFVAARQAGIPTGLDKNTETRLRKALALLVGQTKVTRAIPGYINAELAGAAA